MDNKENLRMKHSSRHDLPMYMDMGRTFSKSIVGKGMNRNIPIASPVTAALTKRHNVVLSMVIGALGLYCFMVLYFGFPSLIHREAVTSKGNSDVRVLYSLVHVQNQTIHTLIDKIQSIPYGLNLYKHTVSDANIAEASHENRKSYLTKSELECESRYGLHIAHEWRATEEDWCKPNLQNSKPATLKCYPFQQKHRAEQGKGKDTFCVAENFVLDFSLIYGDVAPEGFKLFYQVAYLDILLSPVMEAACQRTPYFNPELIGPHSKRYISDFRENTDTPEFQVYETNTTYFLPRDEDCENTFHSLADFMNMFLVKEALNYDVRNQQVLVMDKMPNTQYFDLLKKAFAPIYGAHRHGKYAGKKVMFKKLIFHLESPAALVFPETSTTGPQKCRDSTLFDAYRRHVLQSFNLLDVSPPPIPSVTMITRHRTQLKNVGRVMANENQVEDIIRQHGNMMHFQVVDLATMSYLEQIHTIRSSNIIIGIHGAGLTWIMFAAEEAVLLEIHPSYREDRHFRHIARLTGKDYLPMRSVSRESCQLTSDNVEVPITEFLGTLNEAVRLARNYDSGISECGLHCPSEILAFDERLAPFYDNTSILNYQFTKISKSLDKTFPCPMQT